MRLSDLKQKDVINIRSCRSLGCICDLEFDCKSGCIQTVIIPGPGKLSCFFGHEFEWFIPWKCIVQIGTDIILVDVDEDTVQRKCL